MYIPVLLTCTCVSSDSSFVHIDGVGFCCFFSMVPSCTVYICHVCTFSRKCLLLAIVLYCAYMYLVECDVVVCFLDAEGDSNHAVHKYPSSSHYTHNWDKMVSEIKKEEAEEKPEGDAGLNKFFQQLYAGADDHVKRAMNKSFVCFQHGQLSYT